MSFDIIIFNQINQFAGKWLWLDSFGIFFAEYFGYILIFCLLLFLVNQPAKFWWGVKKYWPMIIQAFLAGIFARFGIVEFIRLLYGRPRPFTFLNFEEQNLGGFIENNVNLLLTHSNTPSFPSGHAAFYFALATIIYFYHKKAGYLFFLSAFLISLARVFIGLHWPSDILAGFLVGIFSAWLIFTLLNSRS